jgi:hypothetical protein
MRRQRPADTAAAAQSSRLAEFGGLGMSFNICRGTLGSLAMFTAMTNASSRVSADVMIECRNFGAMHESATGPSRHFATPQHMVAFGDRADELTL